MPFLHYHANYFLGFLQIVKQQTGKTCKIGYNLIFIRNIFLKIDEKTYIEVSQNGPVWSERKYSFLRFFFPLEYAEGH